MPAAISACIINYQTPDLLETAVCSFHRAYPQLPLLIVDNGSQDASPALIRRLQRELAGPLETLFLEKNLYHGPALHLALQRLTSPYVFVLDSDTETVQGGFLEPMRSLLAASEANYGAGQVVTVNKRGFTRPGGTPVLSSAYMLLRREVYHRLPPFVHHGLPTLQNFRAAYEQGYRLQAFPVDAYVKHLGRGTVLRYGYGLGLRSKMDYLLNRLGL